MSNSELNLKFSGDGSINTARDSQAKQKKPWLAVILSLLFPGLGQLYAARPVRGIAISLTLVILNLVIFHTKMLQTPVGLLARVILGAGVLVAIAIDAAKLAKRQNASPLPNAGWTAKNLAGTALILAVNILSGVSLPLSSRAFKVPSASMCPTICEGERIMADMEAFKVKSPQRGDIAMLDMKSGNGLWIKRVIAVGGDSIKRGSHGEILVNGNPLPQPSICGTPRMPTSDGMVMNFDPVTVPAGSFFVVGDNLSHSNDSRAPGFGYPSAGEIRGKPLYLYWSPIASRIGCKLR